MSWMYGEDYAYALSRLEHTIVRHAGRPVTVHDINGNGMATLTVLGEVEAFAAPANELDCSPVPLGYANVEAGAIYCQRIPARRYRQGLSDVTLSCIQNGGAVVPPLKMSKLVDCINNNYPAYADCIRSRISRAWHHDWAANTDKLYYKGGVVGKILEGKPVLSKSYEYLREALYEECDALVRG